MMDAPMTNRRQEDVSVPGPRPVRRRIRNPQSAIRSCFPWLLGAALLTAGGCKTMLPVRQYPSFYDPSIRTVAVVDFANSTLRGPAGTFLSRRLADALKANGTYRVIGPAELKGKLAAAGASIPQGAGPDDVAGALRGLDGIDAFITGTVSGFTADRSTQIEVDYFGYHGGYGAYGWPYRSYPHGWGGYGWYGHRYGHGYGWGYGHPRYWTYDVTRAHVAASAALVRTADAATLHETPIALSARLRSEDPATTADEVLTAAADAVAARIVEAFAIVPKRIKVESDKLLRTARPGAADRLEFTDRFRAGEQKMLAVIRLPRAAARNVFRLAVTRKKDDDVLAETQFEWSARDGSRGFPFSPEQLIESGDTDEYEVKLYAEDQLVIKRKFEIKRR